MMRGEVRAFSPTYKTLNNMKKINLVPGRGTKLA
jgi:hypothetical protein